MREAGLLALLLLLGGLLPLVGDAQADGGVPTNGLHVSYDVQVLDDSTWRDVVAADGVPEHWEWWSNPATAIDANGHSVVTTAFQQAFWRPGANWTDVVTSHVASAAVVRQDSTTFGPLPWSRSDIALNYGPSSVNLITTAPVESSQTLKATKFGAGSIPCGSSIHTIQDRLIMAGSCGDWPLGTLDSLELVNPGIPETVAGAPAVRYDGPHARVWVANAEPVPVRMELGSIRLDLVGLGVERPASPQTPTEPSPTMWATSPLQPWGLDETDIASDFSAHTAYDAALSAATWYPLSLFLLQHPNARPVLAAKTVWQAGQRDVQRWDFVIADDTAVWNGSATRESEGAWNQVTAQGISDVQARPDGVPRLAQIPATVPTVESLTRRWSAWSSEAESGGNIWSYAVTCDTPSCDSATARFEVGRERWEFPTQRIDQSLDSNAQLRGTTSRASFALDGKALGLATSDWTTERPAFVDLQHASAPIAQPAPRFFGIGSEGAKAIVGITLLGALVALAFRTFPFAVTLYARIRTDALPDHPTRSAILDLVDTMPGIRYSELLIALECGKGTLEHHLALLEKGGHLVMVKRNGLATYFRTRQAGEGHAMAWLRSTTSRRILGLLAERPVATAELHRLAGCSRSTAHHHLVRIEAAGLVRRWAGQAEITVAGRKAWEVVRDNPQPT